MFICFYRARFELLCSPLFNKCIEAIREVLEQSGFTADDINKVITFVFYLFTVGIVFDWEFKKWPLGIERVFLYM